MYMRVGIIDRCSYMVKIMDLLLQELDPSSIGVTVAFLLNPMEILVVVALGSEAKGRFAPTLSLAVAQHLVPCPSYPLTCL